MRGYLKMSEIGKIEGTGGSIGSRKDGAEGDGARGWRENVEGRG